MVVAVYLARATNMCSNMRLRCSESHDAHAVSALICTNIVAATTLGTRSVRLYTLPPQTRLAKPLDNGNIYA